MAAAATARPRAVIWLSDSFSEVSRSARSGRRGPGCNPAIFLNICEWRHSNSYLLMENTPRGTHTHTHRWVDAQRAGEELPALIGNVSAYYDDV